MVTMMQWCKIEENKAKITTNLRDTHESIKMNGRVQRKTKGERDEENLWKKESSHATWRREDSKMSGAKSHHLICYPSKIRSKKLEPPLEILPTQDKTQHENSQVSQNHLCRVSLVSKFKL